LPTPRAQRCEIRRISGDTVEIIPNDGQMQYCLVFTHSGKGVVRQLTMSKNNVSLKCPAHEPVLGQAYKIPAAELGAGHADKIRGEEGRVKLNVFFSDRRLEAASVANQLNDMASPSFSP